MTKEFLMINLANPSQSDQYSAPSQEDNQEPPIFLVAYNGKAPSGIEESHCPHCDAPTNVYLGNRPTPPAKGHLAVCLVCRGVLQFASMEPVSFKTASPEAIVNNILELSSLQNHLKELDRNR